MVDVVVVVATMSSSVRSCANIRQEKPVAVSLPLLLNLAMILKKCISYTFALSVGTVVLKVHFHLMAQAIQKAKKGPLSISRFRVCPS